MITRHRIYFILSVGLLLITACKTNKKNSMNGDDKGFVWQVDRFADLSVLRYKVPGFEQLTLKQKELVYFLSLAAICGRDIIYDQNYKHNLCIRKTLEAIYQNYKGDKNTEEWKLFVDFLKQFWFANGMHQHYSTDKIQPHFSSEYFKMLLADIDDTKLPIQKQETRQVFIDKICTILFDPAVDNKRVNLNPNGDIIESSANNFYEDVNQSEVESFYAKKIADAKNKNQSFGLNSKLIKQNGVLQEQVYKVGDLYSASIEKIAYWLEKAAKVAENDNQKQTIESLISYYKTGNLETFDTYNINWVKDTVSKVDFINGFIEVYGDAVGRKGSWEAMVNFIDDEATKRTKIISENAQWFEDNSPIDSKYKKKKVKGISAKVITVAMLGGDSYPSTPIGINLPNANWIRKEYGSKSVTLENICYAYEKASENNGSIEEFAYNNDEVYRAKTYGYVASNMHTDLHECLGHGSGQLMPGVKDEDLKNYYSTLEEARADLFALYYIMSPKLLSLKVLPSPEAAKAEYDNYIRNGLMTQLKRIELGKNLEESHMRNRQLIAKWAYEKGLNDKVIEKVVKDGKTYFVIKDYKKLHTLFGQLLNIVQRIRSEGDFAAAKQLVETYGVVVDKNIHKEVLARFEKLDLPSFRGFINPDYMPVYDKDSNITDIHISYPNNYSEQML